MQMFFSSVFNRLLGTVLLAMVIAALGAYSVLTMRTAEITEKMPANISITGEGEVKVKPDVAQFYFSVTADGKTADEAQKASADKINAVLGFLKEQGVSEADIKTDNYNLFPKVTYDYGTEPCDWNCPPAKEIPDGFEVSQSVSVKVRDLSKSGPLLAGVGERGATGISSLGFVIDDEKPSKEQARDLAIADAKAKADKVAEQFGLRVVRMTSYYESEGYYGEPYYSPAYEGDMMMKSEAGGSPEVPPGEQKITATVNVSFEMK
jgi:uncharacterized protein